MALGLTQFLTEMCTRNISCSLALNLYWPRVNRHLEESHTCVETEKTVIRLHCILVYMCGFYYLYREGLDTVFVSHSPDLHNQCLVFVPSL